MPIYDFNNTQLILIVVSDIPLNYRNFKKVFSKSLAK
jgi:hypothetical protein